jgi:hypothetical protein
MRVLIVLALALLPATVMAETTSSSLDEVLAEALQQQVSHVEELRQRYMKYCYDSDKFDASTFDLTYGHPDECEDAKEIYHDSVADLVSLIHGAESPEATD